MATLAQALARPNVQYEVRLYIKNTSSTWVDFSDRTSNDRLDHVGMIRYKAEGAHSQPVLQAVKVRMRNDDRYWDQDPASAYDPWEGRDVQIRLAVADVSGETNLGTFRIAPDGIETDMSAYATLTLEPLQESMARVSADDIRRGRTWYQQRPWTFLVSELIRSEFGNSSGDLPSSYSIPSDARFTFPDGNKHFSAFGKPPQWDGSSWNSDNTDRPECIEYDSTNDLFYLGIAEKLWSYDPSTDTWTDLGEDSTVGASATVRAVYLCDAGVVVCKWDYDPASSYDQTLYITFYDTTAEGWDTTTRTTRTDFFPGNFWFFNGVYDSSHTRFWRGWGGGGAVDPWGINVYIPFAQYIQENQSGGSVDAVYNSNDRPFERYDGSQWDYTATYFHALPYEIPVGYVGFRGASSINANLEVQLYLGNKPNLAFDRVDGTPDAYLYIVAYNSGTPTFRILRLSITQGSAITALDEMSTTITQPLHSLTLDADKSHVAWIRFVEKVDSTGYDVQNVDRLVLTGSATSYYPLFSNTNLADNEDMMVDIINCSCGSATEHYHLIKLKTARVMKFPTWQVVEYEFGLSPGETILASSSAPFIAPRQYVSSFPVVFGDAGTGSWATLTDWATFGARFDSGRPPVYDAPWCVDFRFGSGSDPDIYGLSAPGPHPESQVTPPEGKYYLWQYASKHTGRIELADFSGMDKMEALYAICEALRHKVYVDADGDWIVEPRDSAGSSSGTIAPDRLDTKGWSRIKRLKAADIVNYVEIEPYEARLGGMETKAILRPDSRWDGNIYATQIDTAERRVLMRCIKGGYITPQTAVTPTRWDVLVYRNTIRTRLGAAYTSGTSVTLESAWDVDVGDQIQVADSALRTVTAVNLSTGVVTISSAFGTSHPILAPVAVTKANQRTWSSGGVTALDGAINSSVTSVDVDNAEDIGVGNLIIVGEEEMEVTDKSGNTLTVVRGDNAASHSDGDTVGMLISPADLGVWTLVGNQGIIVQFSTASTSSPEKPFKVGDLIDFTCPGLQLEKAKQSRVIVADQTSISDHGKRAPRGRIDNRFLDFRLAEFYGDDIVTRYASRKRPFVLTMPLDLAYFTGNVITVESEAFLPDETSYQLDCIVRDVGYDPFGANTEYVAEEQ